MLELLPPGESGEDGVNDADLDLNGLAARWAPYAALPPMSAEQMRGADARAQRLGVSGDSLMEAAGAAAAIAARALLRTTGREDKPVLVLCGPGNNGGDGLVCARHLDAAGLRLIVALVAGRARPTARDATRNWERLSATTGVTLVHCPTAREVHLLMAGVERAALLVDALLGTGVRGPLREPIRTCVEELLGARRAGVPLLSVDTPTVVDLSSGDASNPVVRADVTVTFHRPKHGLLTRTGRALAGKVLVAPIGIPREADLA